MNWPFWFFTGFMLQFVGAVYWMRFLRRHDELIKEAQALVIEQLELQLDAYLQYGKEPKYSSEELKDRNQLWAGANAYLRRIK